MRRDWEGLNCATKRVRERSEGSVQLRSKISRMELAKEIVGGVIGEAHVGAEEFLVENGSAQKMSHLLFFDRFARKRQAWPRPEKTNPVMLAVNGSQKSEFAFFEIEFHVAAAEFDAVGGSELVGGGGIETQGVDERRRVRAAIDRLPEDTAGAIRQDKTASATPDRIQGSVVTFGIAEQGREGPRRRGGLEWEDGTFHIV